MNKYALIISAVATMSGVSNVFCDTKTVLGSAKEFCSDVFDKHPGKMAFAGALALSSAIMEDGHLPFAAFEKTQVSSIAPDVKMEKVLKSYKTPFSNNFVVVGLVTYSALKTAYDRSKK